MEQTDVAKAYQPNCYNHLLINGYLVDCQVKLVGSCLLVHMRKITLHEMLVIYVHHIVVGKITASNKILK